MYRLQYDFHRVPLENFSLIWRRHHYIAGEVLQSLTYAQRSWPLSSEGSLACQTYCDTGHPFIMVIFEDPWHSHLLPNVWQWSCHYLLFRLRSVATGGRTPISRTRGEPSTSTPPRRSLVMNKAITKTEILNWLITFCKSDKRVIRIFTLQFVFLF